MSEQQQQQQHNKLGMRGGTRPRPSLTNKVAQRWNPGSASSAFAAMSTTPDETTSTSSSNKKSNSSAMASGATNPSAKNDTFVSEGSVRDRLAKFGTPSSRKLSVDAPSGSSTRKSTVEPSSSSSSSSHNKRASMPTSSSTHSVKSVGSASSSSVAVVAPPAGAVAQLSTSSHHNKKPETLEELTGGSSHKDRMAMWGKATSISKFSGHGVVVKPTKSEDNNPTANDKDTKAMPPPPKRKVVASSPFQNKAKAAPSPATTTTTSRSSFASRGSIGKKAPAPVPAAQPRGGASSPIPSDMPKGGLSVRDRMKSWGKSTPVSLSTETSSPSPASSSEKTKKRPVVAVPQSLPAHSLQPTASVDTQDSALSKKSQITDGNVSAANSSSTTGAAASSSSLAATTLRRILLCLELVFDWRGHLFQAHCGKSRFADKGVSLMLVLVFNRRCNLFEVAVGIGRRRRLDRSRCQRRRRGSSTRGGR